MAVGQDTGLDEPVIDGPFYLFNDSMVLEFLRPHPSRKATVLFRATYKAVELCKKGKSYPQVPPYHLHFNQSETFQVLSGEVGTIQGYDCVEKIHRPSDMGSEGVEIPPWTPHTFFPSPTMKEDSTLILWPNPDSNPNPIDDLYFKTVLRYLSDVVERKETIDGLQMMLSQHVTASTLVWLPTWSFLGSLRWYVPYMLQASFAKIATLTGRKPYLKQYLTAEDIERWEQAKKTQ